jgi:hypothetical protein
MNTSEEHKLGEMVLIESYDGKEVFAYISQIVIDSWDDKTKYYVTPLEHGEQHKSYFRSNQIAYYKKRYGWKILANTNMG